MKNEDQKYYLQGPGDPAEQDYVNGPEPIEEFLSKYGDDFLDRLKIQALLEDCDNLTDQGKESRSFIYLTVERSFGIADKDIKGFTPTFNFFKTYDHERNREIVDELNGMVFGLTPLEAAKIYTSTL